MFNLSLLLSFHWLQYGYDILQKLLKNKNKSIENPFKQIKKNKKNNT